MKKILNINSITFQKEEIESFKEYSLICYIPIVAFILLFYKKINNSKYVLFHINQGINLSIVFVITFMLFKIINIFFSLLKIILLIKYLIYSFIIFETIFGIINTFNSKSIELPIIGKYNLIKK